MFVELEVVVKPEKLSLWYTLSRCLCQEQKCPPNTASLLFLLYIVHPLFIKKWNSSREFKSRRVEKKINKCRSTCIKVWFSEMRRQLRCGDICTGRRKSMRLPRHENRNPRNHRCCTCGLGSKPTVEPKNDNLRRQLHGPGSDIQPHLIWSNGSFQCTLVAKKTRLGKTCGILAPSLASPRGQQKCRSASTVSILQS